mgnify:CR=1 FL=1
MTRAAGRRGEDVRRPPFRVAGPHRHRSARPREHGNDRVARLVHEPLLISPLTRPGAVAPVVIALTASKSSRTSAKDRKSVV